MTRQVFTLPDLGEGLEDAQLVRWLVEVGDPVAVDAPVAEVETAKAMVEVPCPYAGIVTCLHGAAGDVIAVGSPLVSVDAQVAAAHDAEEEPAGGSGNVLIGYGTSHVPEKGAGRRAARRVAQTATAHPTGSSAATNRALSGVAVASPLVRTLAKAAGVDLNTVLGTGPGGLVTRSDVEQAAGTGAPGPTPAAGSGPVAWSVPEASASLPGARTDQRTGLVVRERVPLRGVRRTIAAAMVRSRQEIPEATTWVDVDATDLLALRATLASGDRKPPGLLALVARFVVAGLARFPELNARVDMEGGEIVHLDGVNLGIAAQTDRGLVVPVVRGAHLLRIRALDDEIRRVTTVAREGRATATDLTGGSFTLNNYGTWGVDGSAAIINHPEVAILGMGRVVPRAWVVDGAVVPRSVMQLSLAFDHRVCDGAAAGGFLRYVADAVEQPVAALVDAADL